MRWASSTTRTTCVISSSARIGFLEQHDQPYEQYVASGMHFATTRVEVDYHRPARFADVVEITVWAEAVRFASLRMAYVLRVGDEIVATGATEHACRRHDGKVCRLPKERRKALLGAGGEDLSGLVASRGLNVRRISYPDLGLERVRDRRACAWGVSGQNRWHAIDRRACLTSDHAPAAPGPLEREP